MRALLQKISYDKKLLKATSFVVKVLLVYLIWKILFFLFNQEGTVLNKVWILFTDWFAYITIQPAAFVLQKYFGYELIYNHRNIIINGTPGLFLANHCLGVSVCVIFSGFIIAYKGSWLHKLWYIPVGILCIYAINVTRLVGFGFVQHSFSTYFFELAHTRVYLLMSYGMFFLLIVLWMNYFSKK